ncbi:hypothetical protein IFM61606_07757 [Aspergillus udagawae]|uniref:Secreted protein CSS2 C-terminal domain-containing protein n=1 Tax=Aspergillus udagawae TaxID=91492 RepID=A0ABQ1AKI8_9EURO|nr:hypothetical protein IFM51744_05219 [Aspergillus udagawae]GFF83581.1 hypothetical protein IFM53868_03858 [Aspergillus udagawae]GFG05612.1 hypothetical protein IFM5058_02509 [Aspergillus udagawae]GFG27705.1 hypothetical protein IFM61606_07757 [Aspergillus udagawae]
MPSFDDFHIFCNRYILPILLHTVIGLTAIQYYVFPEDCAANDLLRTNMNACVILALDWHQKRAPGKPTPINVCLAMLMALLLALLCLDTLDILGYSPRLTGVLRGLSDEHSCRRMTDTFDNVKWSFYATGQHCNTTAQEATVQGAIADYIRNAENGTICGTQCLRLDHGGTWNGWLKLGSVSSFNENAYCGIGLPFDKCISGGNDDI